MSNHCTRSGKLSHHLTMYPVGICSPVNAYLIDLNLFNEINPGNLFQWEFFSSNNLSLKRVKSWGSDDLINGNLEKDCIRLIEQKIRPVVLVKADTKDRNWFLCYSTFTERMEAMVDLHLIIDEYDERFDDLCSEIFFPDSDFMLSWRKAFGYKSLGITVFPDLPGKLFFSAYEKSLKDWLVFEKNRLILMEKFEHNFSDDPIRNFSSDEFELERKEENVVLIFKNLPFIKIEGKFEAGSARYSSHTGFFSQEFAERIISNYPF